MKQHGWEALQRGAPGARPRSGQTTLLCFTLPCPALLCLLSLLWFREMPLVFHLWCFSSSWGNTAFNLQ